MFGIFDDIEESVSNAIDVFTEGTLTVASLGECGDLKKEQVAKLIADGIEIAMIAEIFDVTEDVIKEMMKK